MTDFVRLVRGADALLAAGVQLDAAVGIGARRLLPARSEALARLEGAAALAGTAAELVAPGSRPAARAIDDARAAIDELGRDLPVSARLRGEVAPVREQLRRAHELVVRELDAAPLPQDPDVQATWTRAAKLVQRGIELPPTMRDSGRALLDAGAPVEPGARLAPALVTPLDEMSGRDLAELARIIRRFADARPDSIAHLKRGVARDLERASRLVDAGIDLPPRWRSRVPLEHARARTMWPTLESAVARVRQLAWSRGGPRSAAELGDLRGLRAAGEDARPPALDVLPRGAGTAPLDIEQLRALRAATATDPARARVAGDLLDATDELAGLLPRQHVLSKLRALRERLATFADLELPAPERGLLDDTIELVDRNLARQLGERHDGYQRWTDLGELGRVTENAELLGRLEGTRDAPYAAVRAAGAGDAAGAADDLLSW